MIQLMQGDCLERMKEIPDGSVDMILTDPPYGTTACKWDSIIPLEPMWAQLKRIIKPNGAIVMTASQPFTTALIASNMKMFKYCWVWVKNKPSGFAQSKNKPMTKHEDICVFSDGVTVHANQTSKRMPYFPVGLIEINKEVSGARPSKGAGGMSARPSHKKKIMQTHTNYPDTILNFDKLNKSMHPTQKPVALMEYLIKTYTNEGDKVLDFTMGSGTTGVACMNLNRKFIGIELDADYFRIAQERIQKAIEELGEK